MTHAGAIDSSSSDASKPQAGQGGVKETIEQILVAFILAFVFRCYIVEAFVIPTGSMAPTLLGAHMNFRCADCGYHFSVNYTAGGDSPDGSLAVPDVAGESYPVRCPNCGYRFPYINPNDPENDANQPAVQYGDRILVQKYVYLLHEPNRWDVVVFKNPDQPSAGSERYQDNFIKRLIGLPGETLMVLDGDIYTATKPVPKEQLTAADFTVQTKTKSAQDALWRVVYDDDYRPRGLSRTYTGTGQATNPNTGAVVNVEATLAQDAPFTLPWKADPRTSGWDTSSRTLRFDGSGTSGLQYDTGSMPEKFPLTDWLAYDVNNGSTAKSAMRGVNGFLLPGYKRGTTPLNNVSDVKLAASYKRLGGDGDLRLSTTKQGKTFTAVVAPEEVRLEMQAGDAPPQVIGRKSMRAGNGKPARIELVNADYRVSLSLDGTEIAATTPQQFAPDVDALLKAYRTGADGEQPRIRIEAANQQCEVSHVGLWRDVYYLNDRGRSFYWGMPSNFPSGDDVGQLVQLGPDEFYTLGDNSMLSGDARVWRMAVNLPYENLAVQAGRVPRRFMLGRAFFVYWPAGFAPVSSLPAFVPNFGEMRFIH